MHAASVRLRHVLVLNAEMEYLMRRHLRVNDTDFDAMQHLLKHRSMSPGELARALHITSAATTTVVDRLVRAGHARRAQHAKDRRRLVIEPTESSAKHAMGLLMPMILEADQIVRDMEPRQQEAVVAYLDAITEAMERQLVVLAADRPAPAPTTSPEGTP